MTVKVTLSVEYFVKEYCNVFLGTAEFLSLPQTFWLDHVLEACYYFKHFYVDFLFISNGIYWQKKMQTKKKYFFLTPKILI